MTGLVTPRGLAFGPDGGLYVAEAGQGGDGPSIILGSGAEAFFGTSGAVSRLLNGVQQRVVEGLPGTAAAGGVEAGGINDLAFGAGGEMYGLFGFGGDPAQRSEKLGDPGAPLGTIARIVPSGASYSLEPVADLAAHELANNPDGTTVDSNPFKFAMTPSGGFVVADAGGNDFLSTTTDGLVTVLDVLAPRDNPLSFGPPMFSSVPTAVAIGPDADFYIGQLTGFPFPPGEANVYRYDPDTDQTSVAYTGFTNIIDVAFDDEGDLYVLQITTNGLASPQGPGPGQLVKIDVGTGERTTIASAGLTFPGGLAIGPDGALYVTNRTNMPEGGEVLRISQIPEPTSIGLGVFFLSMIVLRKRRHGVGGSER
jgi:hypothetical protein